MCHGRLVSAKDKRMYNCVKSYMNPLQSALKAVELCLLRILAMALERMHQ